MTFESILSFSHCVSFDRHACREMGPVLSLIRRNVSHMNLGITAGIVVL